MQQRQLRLGDILDDYCPRERRITSHAVVAMIEDEVKQTRCTACHADHEFKGAKVPPPRRKRPEAASGEPVERTLRPKTLPHVESPEELSDANPAAEDPFEPSPAEAENPEDASLAASERVEDDGPVHRRLIRATLPRPEGQVPERKAPDFTVRQPGGRGGRGEFDGNRAGQRFGQGRPDRVQGDAQPRFGGPRQGGDGSGQGRPGSNRGGQPGGPRGNRPGQGAGRSGGRKRSR